MGSGPSTSDRFCSVASLAYLGTKGDQRELNLIGAYANNKALSQC